ncbi:MAG: chromosomal replication initiator protein DnaA [Erysipelotrichaceae bacterium]
MSTYIKNHFEDVWQKTLDLVKESETFDLTIFNTWIKDSYLYDVSDEFATIVVPYKINKQVFDDNIRVFHTKLSAVLQKEVNCQVILKDEVDRIRQIKEPAPIVFEDKISKNYTFDNFVVGQSNRECHAAALSCAYNPGRFYNPLFIFGNSGLGKTHLLHAIGNYVKEQRPTDKLLYIYSEDFISLVVDAMKTKTLEDIKKKISEVDFLLIDDIQRLASYAGGQEIFFNLYNKLIAGNKQIVITSDIHPSELRGIENRLISRFSSGLSVSVDTPGFETALAILEKKLEGRPDENAVDRDVLNYLATNFSSDVRRLEGALNELFFKAILYNPERITLAFAQEIFKEDPIIRTGEEITVDKIKKGVCEFYGLTKAQIESKSRTQNIANARHIAVYLCRKHLELPFSKIGFEFGNRDHSTIMSSYDKILIMLDEKETFRQAVMKIEHNLGLK